MQFFLVKSDTMEENEKREGIPDKQGKCVSYPIPSFLF
jgi:hypothetical protein